MNVSLTNAPVVRLSNPGNAGRFCMAKGLCHHPLHCCENKNITVIVTNLQGMQSSCDIRGCGRLDLVTLVDSLKAFAQERFFQTSAAAEAALGFEVPRLERWKLLPSAWPRFGVTRTLHAVLRSVNDVALPRGLELIAAFPAAGAPAIVRTRESDRMPVLPAHEPAELAAVDDATLELYGAVDAMRTSHSLSPQTDLASAATDAAYLMDAVSDLSPLHSDADDDDCSAGRSLDIDKPSLTAIANAWRLALATNNASEPAAAAPDTTAFDLQMLAADVAFAALADPTPPSLAPAAAAEGDAVDGKSPQLETTRRKVTGLSLSVIGGYPLRRFDRAVHDVASYCRGDLFAHGSTSVSRFIMVEKSVAAERCDAWAELRKSSLEVRRCRHVKQTNPRVGSIAVPGVATKLRLAQRGVGTIGDDRPEVISARRRRLADARR